MHYRTIAAALILVLLPVASLAQSPPASAPPAAQPPPAAPKTYVPGLEQFMSVIQNEHAKLWYAGSARNWELAAYQLGEIKEVMSDVQDLAPTFKNLPLTQMLDAVTTGEIAALEKAIAAKDQRKFVVGYDKLTSACNACHQATGNGFIVIQRPALPAFTNQDFRPHR
jgi:cytochrome c553